jgi:hypothetical protein
MSRSSSKWGLKETKHANTPDQLMEWLRHSHEFWKGKDDTATGWVFRGQSMPRPLRPSATRRGEGYPSTRIDRLMIDYEGMVRKRLGKADWIEWLQPEFGGSPNDESAGRKVKETSAVRQWKSRAIETAVHAMVHAKMLADFGLMAASLGLYTDTSKFAWHVMNPRFSYFRDYFEGTVMEEVFGIAQHHGVPTLLLDWTMDPYVAAYFASGGSDQEQSEEIEIWALRWSYLNSEAARVKRVTVRRKLTPYLDAQKGLFTWCPTTYSYRLQHGNYPAHDELVRQDASIVKVEQPLRRVTMKRRGPRGVDNITRLRQLLWREGLSPADVMPSFDNIVRALRVSAPWAAASGTAVLKYQQFPSDAVAPRPLAPPRTDPLGFAPRSRERLIQRIEQ